MAAFALTRSQSIGQRPLKNCLESVEDNAASRSVFDDCSDMDELVPWLVLTHPIDGLTGPDVELAKQQLARSSEGISLARSRSLGIG
jgi:hypothetical protein